MYKRRPKKITLEDLPSLSSWPAKLLSLDHFTIKTKNPNSIIREFNNDKWGKLFKHFIKEDEFTLANVKELEQDIHKTIACFDRKIGFYLTTVEEAEKKQIEIFKNNLVPYIKDASCLIELGAGYGSKLFSLSDTYPFDKLPLYAAEYTKAGRELIKLIARKINKQTKVGNCDFGKLYIDNLEIPKNSIIFTSYSLHYVPKLKREIINFISKLKPKAVVHFEPCYEYFDKNSLHGLMCKRYMQLNDYTKNIASAIKEGCLEKGAKFEEERNIFGTNPFLPFTIIRWFPK